MVFKSIVDRIIPSEEEPEEFVEVNEEPEQKKISVRIDTVKDYTDAERIQNMLREGNVVFLRIKELREKDITELKRVVDKLRKTTLAMDGDIVGVDEDFLILTPRVAKIYRGKAS